MALTLNEISNIVRDSSAHALERLDPRARATAEAAIFAGFSAQIRANPKNMTYMLSVSEASVAQCVTAAAITGIYPTGTASTGAYLVPTDGQLCYRLTHRGYAALALRIGLVIHAVPVGVNDEIEVDFDEVTKHRRADLSKNPTSLDEMLGVYVTIRDTRSGITIRPWVPISVGYRAKASSKATKGPNPWGNDACQMAIGACVRYLVLRGTIAIAGEAGAALAAAERADAIDAEFEEAAAPAPARRTVALPTGTPRALPGPAPIPESRQLAAAPPEADWSPAPEPVYVQQAPTPTPATRAAPEWAGALKAELAALVRATGAKSSSAALAAVGIAVPEAPDIEALRAEIIEATTNALERSPEAK